MQRVTGIGGVFFKARDAEGLRAWYRRHLGLDIQDWGGLARTFVLAALSAALAWGVAAQFLAGAPPVLRLAVGAAVLGAAYAATNLRGALSGLRVSKEQA